MPRKIESLFIPGPAGRLEALLEEPDEAPSCAALVCHPHPQHGGTMHNKVVYRVARGLRRTGAVVLRFNYRGVNLSEGTFAHSVGETDDARTALRFLRGRYPDLPFTVAGFSFGSRIAIKISEGATRAFAVGFPTIYPDRSYVREASTPLVFVQSTHDEFGPLADLEPFVASLPRSPKLLTIEAADHFFAGALEKLEDVVAAEAASAPV